VKLIFQKMDEFLKKGSSFIRHSFQGLCTRFVNGASSVGFHRIAFDSLSGFPPSVSFTFIPRFPDGQAVIFDCRVPSRFKFTPVHFHVLQAQINRFFGAK